MAKAMRRLPRSEGVEGLAAMQAVIRRPRFIMRTTKMDAETRRHFEAHLAELLERALAGDEFSVKSLSCMALLNGCPSPDGPDGGGEEVIDLSVWRTRLAA